MIELIQFPWSPFCLVQRRILEFSGAPFKVTNLPPSDRSLVWRATRQRYYQVPIVREGRTVVFETSDDSQVIAKYLEAKLQLALFPPEWDGVQKVIWHYIETVIEGLTFKLNDAHYREFVPAKEQLPYLRHKERKFGPGCLDQWRAQQEGLVEELTRRLVPFEQMLAHRDYLLDGQPRFVDFDLWGMLANFQFSGHYPWPAAHSELAKWYARVSRARHHAG
jgi:glutathione S-transferase